jgi:hypothetical protein
MPVARKLWQLILVLNAGRNRSALQARGQLAMPEGREEGSGGLTGESGRTLHLKTVRGCDGTEAR